MIESVMDKKTTTRENILKAAFEFTSKFGLESLTIGELAKAVGMSKSGLFGHFKSKEKLQIMVLDYASENFVTKVVAPALLFPRGLERLDKMMDNWQEWSSSWLTGGCPFLSSVVEYDDRPGPVQDHLKKLLHTILSTYKRSLDIAKELKQIREDVDTEQVAYDIYSNMVGFHIYNRLLKDELSKKRFQRNYFNIISGLK